LPICGDGSAQPDSCGNDNGKTHDFPLVVFGIKGLTGISAPPLVTRLCPCNDIYSKCRVYAC
jgi:hypothetical protein